jgi:hydantoinase/carbamoylase family amidase
MTINKNRLYERLQQIATYGADLKGGVSRLAFTDSDWDARNKVMEWMQQAGLSLHIDSFGNIIARREGINPNASVVMTGSHLDTVPNGGNFDGVVGVLAAIEAMQCLEEQGICLEHPIEVVVFAAEESSRFGAATLGSKAFTGKLTKEELEKYTDNHGITLASAMQEKGLAPENVHQACYTEPIKAFLELHIEQGKVLETSETTIGIVTAIAAPTRLRVTLIGQADHSGATPMSLRQDALTAAAELILLVEKLAQKEANYGSVGTTGIIKATPGVMNVIPGKVELGIDIRGICPESKKKLVENFIEEAKAITQLRGISTEIEKLTDELPVPLSPSVVALIEATCKDLRYSALTMPSGAGHDAMHIATLAETGMIFIPCRGGVSHNPAEWSSLESITAGTEVLLSLLMRLANNR